MTYQCYKDGVLVGTRKLTTQEYVSLHNKYPTIEEQRYRINIWNMNSGGWSYVLL